MTDKKKKQKTFYFLETKTNKNKITDRQNQTQVTTAALKRLKKKKTLFFFSFSPPSDFPLLLLTKLHLDCVTAQFFVHVVFSDCSDVKHVHPSDAG